MIFPALNIHEVCLCGRSITVGHTSSSPICYATLRSPCARNTGSSLEAQDTWWLSTMHRSYLCLITLTWCLVLLSSRLSFDADCIKKDQMSTLLSIAFCWYPAQLCSEQLPELFLPCTVFTVMQQWIEVYYYVSCSAQAVNDFTKRWGTGLQWKTERLQNWLLSFWHRLSGNFRVLSSSKKWQ